MEGLRRSSEPVIQGEFSILILAIGMTVSLGVMVPVGYSFGVVNALSDVVKTWLYYNIENRYLVVMSESKTRFIWHLIVSLYVMGGIIASLISAWYCDRYGRKGTLVIAAFLLLMSAFFVSFCKHYNSIEMLIIGRVVGGIAASFVITAQPMYLLEITPAAYKSTMGSLTGIGMTVGIALSQLVTLQNFLGSKNRWPVGLGAFGIIVFLFLLFSYWLPESPRWLYSIKNDPYKAEKNLKLLWNNPVMIESELASIRAQKVLGEGVGLIGALYDRKLLIPFILVGSLHVCQQLCGINGLFYYSVDHFVAAGLSERFATLTNLFLGCVNLAANLLSPIIINMVTRRLALLVSFGGCGMSLFAIAITLSKAYHDNYFWKAVVLCFLIIYLVFFQVGIGTIPFFIGSELFEVGPRSVAMSVGSFCNWSSNFIVAATFPGLYGAIGAWTFIICAAACLYGFLVTYYLLAGKELQLPADFVPQKAEQCDREGSDC